MKTNSVARWVCPLLLACGGANQRAVDPVADGAEYVPRLVLALSTGDSLVLDDQSTPGAQGISYRILDTLAAQHFYLVEYSGYESRGVLAVSRRSGAVSPIEDVPVLAPSAALFAATHWDDGGFAPTRLAVYRFGADTLAAEWDVLPFAWGPDSVRWLDDSTAIVWRSHILNDSLQGTTLSPFTLRQRRGAWSLDSSARAP